MKILSANQIRDLDAFTIKHEPVRSIDLMERACRAFVNEFVQRFNESHVVGVVTGTGNNGGDGLGIARLLHLRGYSVKVWIVRGSAAESDDFKQNLKRLPAVEVKEISSPEDKGLFNDADVLIDAIFGSGLSRPVSGIYEQVIQCFNAAPCLKVAVDIPSGLMADKVSEGEIARSHHTISFQLPKLSFFFPSSYQYTGEWQVVDIGLKKSFIQSADSDYHVITAKAASRLVRHQSRFDHKGTNGHALLIAGSFGKVGAAIISAKAVLHTGAGLLTAHLPKCGYEIMQTSLPEAMVLVDKEESHFSGFNEEVDVYKAIGIGPGLGQSEHTIKGVADLLAKFRKSMVIDADALNILAANRELLHLVPEHSILTPHPKEFERLVGPWQNDFERLEKQMRLAKTLKSVIVLKGAYTSIALPSGKVFFNTSGNPGMATGGTGDALTGILTGLLAQSYPPDEAAILGIYLHGIAGDIAAAEMGGRGFLASDLVEYIPAAYKKIFRA